MSRLNIRPNSVFEWNEGRCLKALSRTMIVLPAGIISEGEPLKNVLELSNDETPIAVQESKSGNGYDFMIVDLQSGDSMKLKRSTEVIFRSNQSSSIVFEVEE